MVTVENFNKDSGLFMLKLVGVGILVHHYYYMNQRKTYEHYFMSCSTNNANENDLLLI